MVVEQARMLQRRRTAAQWFTENPILAAGEIGDVTDIPTCRIGDGSTVWNSLPLATAGPLDIRLYGATASAARAGIQAALNQAALFAAAGLEAGVWIPPGTWQLDDDIVMPNNVYLCGAGPPSILRMDNATDQSGGAVILLNTVGTAATNMVVEDLTIDGNMQGQTTSTRHGIMHNSELSLRNIWLRNLIIKNVSHYGIGLQGHKLFPENIWIENIYVENARGDPIDIKSEGGRNCFITNFACHYYGTDVAYPGQAALDLRGTWVVNGVDIRSVANNVHTDNVGVRFRQSGGEAGAELRAGAIGCVVRGVTVALTGSAIANDVAEGTGAGINQYAATGNSIDVLAYRRANVIHLASGNVTVDGTTSVPTTSVTPRPNVLHLISVLCSGTNAVQPTLTGCGMTWTLVRSRAHNANNRLSLYRAMAYSPAPPTTGQVTIDFGGVGQNTVLWRWDEIENVSLLSDADAIVQSADNTVSTGTALAVTLAAFNHVHNGVYSTFATWNTGVEPDTEAGYAHGYGTSVETRSLQTVWRPDNDTTPGVTHASASMTGIACELRVTRP